jgi:hypothetical protein
VEVIDRTVGPGDAAVERDSGEEDHFAHAAIVYGKHAGVRAPRLY